MNRWQKIAWFNLVVVVLGALLTFMVAYTLPAEERLMKPNRVSLVIIVWLVLVVLGKSIFRKKADKIDLDERDKQIRQKAMFISWIAFALSLMAGVMVYYYFALGPKSTANPLMLPVLGVIAGGVYVVAESVATLIQYGKGGGGHE